MSGILWICTLFVVLAMIQLQSISTFAEKGSKPVDYPRLNSTNTTAVTCEPIETPSGAIRRPQTFVNNTYGSKYVFTCRPGYIIKGWKEGQPKNVTRTCLQSGKWSGVSISCTAVTCKPSKIPAGAILKNGTCNTTYGSKCVFTCKHRVIMNSCKDEQPRDVTRTCLQSGKWSGDPITCPDTSKPTSPQEPISLNSSSTPEPDLSQDPPSLNKTSTPSFPKPSSSKTPSTPEPDLSQDPPSLTKTSTPSFPKPSSSKTPKRNRGRQRKESRLLQFSERSKPSSSMAAEDYKRRWNEIQTDGNYKSLLTAFS